MKNIDELLTIQDVANYLKVTPQYARKLIKEEKLIAQRIAHSGGLIRMIYMNALKSMMLL